MKIKHIILLDKIKLQLIKLIFIGDHTPKHLKYQVDESNQIYKEGICVICGCYIHEDDNRCPVCNKKLKWPKYTP